MLLNPNSGLQKVKLNFGDCKLILRQPFYIPHQRGLWMRYAFWLRGE